MRGQIYLFRTSSIAHPMTSMPSNRASRSMVSGGTILKKPLPVKKIRIFGLSLDLYLSLE